ncbi:hypothetical protein [Actinomadura geliboluensis]|uniref:Uncharacterized protein n=1 Tax=Actinomadura geliboluensis TaxID=882440 RepID=A0A5S4GUR3_9ACTN|nr:hypothetical protein [Actinomadura geliboluensis]TMR36673.1 hypothetical protein ETD96_20315 [Actinomadura geliboluensis]
MADDIHANAHVMVALDQTSVNLAVTSVPMTRAGYRKLLKWTRDLGEVAGSDWKAPAPTAPG